MNSMIDWILDVYKAEDIEILERSTEEYSYLKDGESIVVFKNPFNEDCNLYVFFLQKRYTLIFGNWSCHFNRNVMDEKSLFYALELILNKQAHVLSIYNDNFIVCALCYKNRLFFSTNASERLTAMMKNREFLQSAANGEITISRLYWEQPAEFLSPSSFLAETSAP